MHEALTLLHPQRLPHGRAPDLSGKFSFFTRDDDVLASKKRVATARRETSSAVKNPPQRASGTGGGKPPVIPPEVFKLVDEGDGNWRSRLTSDDGAKNALHEWVSFIQLARNGYYVHVINRSNEPHVKRPDILLDGVDTEIKAPMGGIANTVNANLREARKQSSQIIIDCHRTEL